MTGHPEEGRDSGSPATLPLLAFSRLEEGDFHRRLAATPGVSVVLFSAPNCGACRTWKSLLPNALSGLTGNLFEVDVSEATGVARYFGIFHLPTIYLYRDGHFHAELQCEARPASIRATAQQLLAGPAQEEP